MNAAEILRYQQQARRKRVCRVIWDEMNTWMHAFAVTTYAVAQGLLDGTLTEEIILAYLVDDYPVDLSRAIAQQVGLPFNDGGEPQYNGSGWRIDVDAEEIGIGVQALRAIPAADVGRNDQPGGEVWQLYPGSLDSNHVTIGQVRDFLRGMTLRDAAQLLVDANKARP